MTPSAASLNAKGSFDTVGLSSIIQNPVKVSILSANATAVETADDGTMSVGPSGE